MGAACVDALVTYDVSGRAGQLDVQTLEEDHRATILVAP